MAQPQILTFADTIDTLVDFCGGGALSPEQREFRAAVLEAYREVGFCREWDFFKFEFYTQLQASYSTGTIEYDHEGGAFERLVTLTGGTWPTWALYGRLAIAGVDYEIARRIDGTQLQLSTKMNPGQDVAAATAYTLYQIKYPLPADFRKMTDIFYEGVNWEAHELPPAEMLALAATFNPTTGQTEHWSLIPSADQYGTWDLWVWPYPTEFKKVHGLYQGAPRQLHFSGYETNSKVGTVAGTLGDTALTGTSTAFSTRHQGSIIRLSGSSALPTGTGGLNEYQEQRVLYTRTSATAITLDAELENTYAGAGYMITDPIDLPADMIELFLATCQYKLAIKKGMKSAGMLGREAQRKLMYAMDADHRVMARRWVGESSRVPRLLSDMPYDDGV